MELGWNLNESKYFNLFRNFKLLEIFQIFSKSRIFEIFQRLHGRTEYSGTGIGLAIVHQLTLAMDGEVDMINAEPGAEFWLLFPVSE